MQHWSRKAKLYVGIGAGFFILFLAGIFLYFKDTSPIRVSMKQKAEELQKLQKGLLFYEEQPQSDFSLYAEPVKVKGIYLSGHSIGIPQVLDKWIRIANTTEINSMVIDVKDDDGRIPFSSDIPTTKAIGANGDSVEDIDEVMRKLQENRIYAVARIVAFKDPLLAKNRPEWALKKKDGSIWRDRKGIPWINAYNKEVWKYLVEVGKEAARRGFKEVQFDYVRFPTDGNLQEIDYGLGAEQKDKTENIAAFLSYARKELNKEGIYVSADVFGTIISSELDAKIIGQSFIKIAQNVDYIYPMIYPSHYNNGYEIRGIKVEHPDLQPYDVVYHSCKQALERFEKESPNQKVAGVRPWLQDFTATWVQPHQTYGPKQLRDQIKGLQDAGIEEWVLWNAGNAYTVEGLLKE